MKFVAIAALGLLLASCGADVSSRGVSLSVAPPVVYDAPAPVYYGGYGGWHRRGWHPW